MLIPDDNVSIHRILNILLCPLLMFAFLLIIREMNPLKSSAILQQLVTVMPNLSSQHTHISSNVIIIRTSSFLSHLVIFALPIPYLFFSYLVLVTHPSYHSGSRSQFKAYN